MLGLILFNVQFQRSQISNIDIKLLIFVMFLSLLFAFPNKH
jgi:hypothetical protein